MGIPPDAATIAKSYARTIDRARALICGGDNQMKHSYLPTIVIGGGQAGLAVGYYLAKRGLPFVILDAHPRVGDAWRNRWDSLRLFSPARYSGLPGLRFPAPGGTLPTRQQMADYLVEYARHFQLPILNGVKVDRLWKEGARFQLSAGKQRFQADNVIVAMANYQQPRVPGFASQLDPRIVQLHSHNYKNPSQLQEGGVLVVGVGNSGGDIAMEVARTHRTWISGKESGHIPWPIDTFVSRNFLSRLVRFVGHHVLTVKTPMGRKARPKLLHQATPLIRVKPQDLENAGIARVPRTAGVKDGRPMLADGSTLDVQNVIWCTGYEHGFPWIDLPVFAADGEPIHQEGEVPSVPGLYFVGLHFLYAMSSATLIGIGRDSRRVVKLLAKRVRNGKQLQPVEELPPAEAAQELVRSA
jgi:putative flavoprotein involved in K+ transport